MPRGVYARKSAQPAIQEATAQPVASPKPARKRIRPSKKRVVAPAVVKSKAKVVQLVAPEFLVPPDFKNKRVAIDTLSGAELKAYAKHIGVSHRDIERLTEERLRVNCKTHLYLKAEQD